MRQAAGALIPGPAADASKVQLAGQTPNRSGTEPRLFVSLRRHQTYDKDDQDQDRCNKFDHQSEEPSDPELHPILFDLLRHLINAPDMPDKDTGEQRGQRHQNFIGQESERIEQVHAGDGQVRHRPHRKQCEDTDNPHQAAQDDGRIPALPVEMVDEIGHNHLKQGDCGGRRCKKDQYKEQQSKQPPHEHRVKYRG